MKKTAIVLSKIKLDNWYYYLFIYLHFRNKKKAYLKDKIEDLEINSKIKNIRDLYRGISDFKKGYQLRTIIVKGETGDFVTGSYSILAR